MNDVLAVQSESAYHQGAIEALIQKTKIEEEKRSREETERITS
jgi:hypothetical protein